MISQIFNLSNYTFNLYAVPPVITSILILSLGIFVLIRERFSMVSLNFLFATGAVFLWLFSFSWMYCSVSESVALWWGKTAYLGVTFIPASVYHFTAVVLKIYKKHRKFILLSWILAAVFYSILFMDNHFISGMYYYYWGYYPKLGWVGIPFLLYFSVLMVAVYHSYWTEYCKAAGDTIHRYRIKSLLTALGIAFIATIDFPASFGIPVYPFGYLPIFGFILISTYAMIRYRLIDITPAFAADKIIDTMKDALLVFDQEGVIRVVNQSAVRLFSQGQELIGKPVTKIIDDELFFEKLDTFIKNGIIKNHEIPYEQKGGETKILSLSASVMQDQHAQPVATVYIARDITELKKAEEELIRHRNHLEELVKDRTVELTVINEQLQQEMYRRKKMEEDLLKMNKLESVSLLAGGIAHDFNNLLTAILGNIDLYMMTLKPEDKGYNWLVKAENAANRAKGLTQQLLTFSKGGTPIKKTVTIRELIKESAEFILSGSGCKCEYSIAEGLWPVDVDEGQINRVINNLVINAANAMPDGGTIDVTAENITITPEDYFPLKNGKHIKISIKDYGTGVCKEHLSKIFDPYFTTKYRGSGLGLAATYSIIKKHNGYITVESEKGTGTTFYFYLPASEKDVETEGESEGQAFVGKVRILVMDDEEDIRNTLGAILKQHFGYETGFAKDGTETIKEYRAAKESGNPYDVIIMDLTIPGGMGGKEAVNRLLDIYPEVKAIVSSGYSNDPIMANYREYGFIGIVTKPYNIADLSKTLHKVLTDASSP